MTATLQSAPPPSTYAPPSPGFGQGGLAAPWERVLPPAAPPFPNAYPARGAAAGYSAPQVVYPPVAPPGAVPAPAPHRTTWAQPTTADVVAGVFSAVALVSLFLPWYRFRFSESAGPVENFAHFTALGAGAGGWRWSSLVLSAVIVVYLVVRSITATERPVLPAAHAPLLALLALGNLAVLVVAFFALPDGGASISGGGAVLGFAQDWGAFVGVIAGIFAATATLLNWARPAAGK
jgi:hypothetical protein